MHFCMSLLFERTGFIWYYKGKTCTGHVSPHQIRWCWRCRDKTTQQLAGSSGMVIYKLMTDEQEMIFAYACHIRIYTNYECNLLLLLTTAKEVHRSFSYLHGRRFAKCMCTLSLKWSGGGEPWHTLMVQFSYMESRLCWLDIQDRRVAWNDMLVSGART